MSNPSVRISLSLNSGRQTAERNTTTVLCVHEKRQTSPGVSYRFNSIQQHCAVLTHPLEHGSVHTGNCQGLSDQSVSIIHFPAITWAEWVKWALEELKTKSCLCDLWPRWTVSAYFGEFTLYSIINKFHSHFFSDGSWHSAIECIWH